MRRKQQLTPIPDGVKITRCPPAVPAPDYGPGLPAFGEMFLVEKRRLVPPKAKRKPRKLLEHEVRCKHCGEITVIEDLLDQCCPHCDTPVEVPR